MRNAICLISFIILYTTSIYANNNDKPQGPKFPGGHTALSSFITDNFNYPLSARSLGIEGIAKVLLTLDDDGSVADFQIIQSPGKDFDKEIKKMLSKMPNWIIANSITARKKVILTVDFSLEDPWPH
jgi:TonB family protein